MMHIFVWVCLSINLYSYFLVDSYHTTMTAQESQMMILHRTATTTFSFLSSHKRTVRSLFWSTACLADKSAGVWYHLRTNSTCIMDLPQQHGLGRIVVVIRKRCDQKFIQTLVPKTVLVLGLPRHFTMSCLTSLL